MIMACIYDMLTFMIVLIIGVFAFADAFLSIDEIMFINGDRERGEENPNATMYEKYGQQYVQSWQRSFLISLGEFDENMEFYRESDWLVFFICCIFNIILLLNLLIAIISETYETISTAAVANSYKEKVLQMEEMQDSIFGFFRRFKAPIDSNELLFIAKVQTSDELQQESTNDKIDELTS